MADLSALPALDIDPATFGARANAAMSSSLLAQQEAPLQLQQQQTAAQKATALAPLEIEDEKNQSRLKDIATANDTLAQVAKEAQAADPGDAADVWDRGMKAAADSGVGVASQYVGHYRPDLAERVGDIYGGQGANGQSSSKASAPGAPGPDPQMLDIQLAKMPPAKVVQGLANMNAAISGFNSVKDQQSWDEEIQRLRTNGAPIDQVLPNTDWNPLNYATVARFVKSLTPIRDAMDRAVARQQVGLGGQSLTKPLGTSQYIGSTPDTQMPVYHNATTGEDTVGNVAVGPKPSAAISTFQYKLRAGQAAGMSDQDALSFANGTKALPPERLQAIALTEANKELGDATLAGAQISNPDAWVRDKAAQNYQLLSSKAVQAPGGGGNSSPAADVSKTPPSVLPPRAVAAIKGNGGKPYSFANGQVWTMRGNTPVRVK